MKNDRPMTATEVRALQEKFLKDMSARLRDPNGDFQKSLQPIIEPIVKKLRQLTGQVP